MKKLLCLLLVVCFFLPFKFNVAIAKDDGNLTFTNGDFEKFTTVSSIGVTKYTPKNWVSEGLSLSNAVNKKDGLKYDGKCSVYVKRSGRDVVLVGESVDVVSGASYRVGFMIKDGEQTSVSAQMTIRSYDVNGTLIEESKGQIIQSTAEWTDVYVEATLSESAVSIKPVISVDSASYVQAGSDELCYIDGVYGYEIESKDSIFYLKDGASLRLMKETPGIRFYAEVKKSVYDEYKSKYDAVSAGILITPTENLNGASDFTVEVFDTNQLPYTTIPADKWANEDTCEADGVYSFYCALVNILPKNILRQFSARAYLCYRKDGQVKYIYSDFDQIKNSRSVNEIAKLAQKELEIYDEKQVEIINYYANYVHNT